MKTSDKGIEFIKRLEGCRLIAYRDSGGVWTIGVGHTGFVSPGDIITTSQADALLKQDLEVFERCLNECVKVPLTQNEFDALISFCFNIGCRAFQKSILLKYLNSKDFTNAADQLKEWIYVNHVVNRGLYNRRMREKNLFMTGEYV